MASPKPNAIGYALFSKLSNFLASLNSYLILESKPYAKLYIPGT